MEMLYSYASITLRDALIEDETLLDNLQMSTSDRTQSFVKQFKAMYNTKSIGAETIPLFKIWIENKFQEVLPYYEDLLTVYEKELDYDSGINIHTVINDSSIVESQNDNSNTTVDVGNGKQDEYDLPNRNSIGYLTKENKSEGSMTHNSIDNRHTTEGSQGNKISDTTGNVNVVEQREKALKYIRNIYNQMCMEFKDCFSLIYA